MSEELNTNTLVVSLLERFTYSSEDEDYLIEVMSIEIENYINSLTTGE